MASRGLIHAQTEHLLSNNKIASEQSFNTANNPSPPNPRTPTIRYHSHARPLPSTTSCSSTPPPQATCFWTTTTPKPSIFWSIPSKGVSSAAHKTWIPRVADHTMAWATFARAATGGRLSFGRLGGGFVRSGWVVANAGKAAEGPRI